MGIQKTSSAAMPPTAAAASMTEDQLARRLGSFDVTMLVMGGIVGAGIFINPYVVARQVQTPALILAAWILGGLLALAGGFIWAELAAALPRAGGQYVYIREAFHPLAAFLFGWTLLLVVGSGGMAAVAMTFALYFRELTATTVSPNIIAMVALAILALVNCFGVRAGSNVQSAFMVTKIAAIFLLIACGVLFIERSELSMTPILDRPPGFGLVAAMSAAMVPVLFSYGGWQTSCFVAEEVRHPKRNMPLGLVLGVSGVVALYVLVNVVSLRALGPEGLALTTTPASEVMRVALGSPGGSLIALGIAVSTLGFLSHNILALPRVYFAMARDGLFFKTVAWLHPRTRVPIVAIVLQSVLASLVALSGQYEQILNYVVAIDWIFFGLTGACLFVFRRREKNEGSLAARDTFRMPGHPYVTALFVLVSWLVVVSTVVQFPENAGIGVLILLAGVPVYFLWKRRTV